MINEHIIYQILDLHNYRFGLLSQAILTVCLLVFCLGVLILVMERISKVGALYFLCTTAVTIWLFGESMIIASLNNEVAFWWSKVMSAGTIFIPAALYHFSVSILRLNRKKRPFVLSNWGLTVFFLLTMVFTDIYLNDVHQYPWGKFLNLTPVAIPFFIFFALNQVAAIRMLLMTSVNYDKIEVAKRRAQLLVYCLLLGAVGMTDLIPAFGYGSYPLGFVALFLIFTVVAYITWRYRLVHITPEFAAPKIIETMTDALFVLSPGGIIQLHNKESKKILELSDQEIDGSHIINVIGDKRLIENIMSMEKGQIIQDYETEYVTSSKNKVLSFSVSTTTSSKEDTLAYICIMRDITDIKEKEQQIRFLAFHDSLTSLPNRVLLMERLNYSLSDAERLGHKVSVLFLDLDQFKRINDSMGHNVGDKLLKEVSERLQNCVRKSDLVNKLDSPIEPNLLARFGGDEFILIITHIQYPREVTTVASRIKRELNRPFFLESREVFITTSIGISVYPDDCSTADSLLKNADAAMYQAKAVGRNNFQFFNKEINDNIQKRLAIENDLRKALERNELLLYYQPQVNFKTGKIVGAEALIRWHKNGELILPSEFISIAEESGLIIPIGEWIMSTAFKQMEYWNDVFNIPFTMAVNLSVRQFQQKDFINLVQNTLQNINLEPRFFELEITESITMHKEKEILDTILGLQQLGVNLSIDDFGTGYSSLSYLKKFNIDAIKIDRSFTSDVTETEESAAIITAIIAMAESLSLNVIAEGVENQKQAELLERLGCSNMQGYYFSRPVDKDRFYTLLEKHV
ncbi:MAG: EAL domain-containing protein [Proteobacteria bacterium]|nr:EAL domain-containing protein [Pseudomonadota bacterium]